MSVISSQEMSVAKRSFKRTFKQQDDVVNTSVIEKWIEEAPAGIVDYTGLLKGEDSVMADQRRKLFQVYDGDIKELTEYLRALYKEDEEKNHLAKWDLIFVTYSEIMDVQKVIGQALDAAVFSPEKEQETTPQNEEHVASNNSSVEEQSQEHVEAIAPVEHGAKTVTVSDAKEETQTKKEPSGNVQLPDEDPLFKTNKPIERKINKEERIMANGLEAMKAGAAAASGAAKRPARTQAQKDAAALKAAAQKDAALVISQVTANEIETRKAFSRENFVTAIVSVKPAAALRVVDDNPKGTVYTVKKDWTAEQDIDAKAKKFVQAVSGKAVDLEGFKALSDEEKYAMVYGKDEETQKKNVAIAAAMWDTYLELIANPEKTVPVIIPERPAVPVRGYAISGKIMNKNDFVTTLIDKSTGVMFAEGELDTAGNSKNTKVDEKTGKTKSEAVQFAARKATKTNSKGKKGAKVGASNSSTPQYSLTVRIQNKDRFLAEEGHVIYLFPNTSDKVEGGRFKVAIALDDGVYAASVPYKTGKSVVTKKGESRPETKLTSMSARVDCYAVVTGAEGIIDEAKDGRDNTQTDAYWNVKITKSNNDMIDAQVNAGDISELPVFNLLATLTAGNARLDGSLSESTTLAAITAAKNNNVADAAKATADELQG